MQPLHSRGFTINIPKSQTKEENIRIGYLTGAFCGGTKEGGTAT